MVTISGRLVFDANRSRTIDVGELGIDKVPIVLQNRDTLVRVTALTNTTGDYSFTNVPDGQYRIVEAYGESGGTNPANFALAVVGPIPKGEDPPISFAPSAPAGATNLDSITPNTLFVTVTSIDITDQNFLDGPIIYTPIQTLLDSCVTVGHTNLITAADDGIFGSESAGSLPNAGPAQVPYKGIAPGFNYVSPGHDIVDGDYSILNILYPPPLYEWWVLADHTVGDETGRFQVVNGANPGAIFFRQRVPVTPNTHYLFSTWIANLVNMAGYVDPQLGVEILGESGQMLYKQTLGNMIPINTVIPEWKQIGTVLNAGENNFIEVRFISEGVACATGNDYAIDDVRLDPIQVPKFIPVKSVTPAIARVGEVVTYTVTLTNTCQSVLTNVFFQDTLPEGISFKSGSVTVNSIAETSFNPQTGFVVPNIVGGGTATITFQAEAISVPRPNPTHNRATMHYDYTPVQGGIPNTYHTTSNTVPLKLKAAADLKIIKTAYPSPILPGDRIYYTLDIINLGPSTATEVVVTDAIPSDIKRPIYSLNNGVTWEMWYGEIELGTLIRGESRTLLISGLLSSESKGNIVNTATVSSPVPDPNPNNNTSTVRVSVMRVDIEKDADESCVQVGEIYTYTLTIKNTGEVAVPHIFVKDILSPDLRYEGNLKEDGSLIAGNITQGIDIDMLAAGETVILTFDVQVITLSANRMILNNATIWYEGKQQISSRNGVGIYSPSIHVTKTSDEQVISIGEPVIYTIEVTNTGDVVLDPVEVTDALPAGFNVESIEVDGLLVGGNIRTGLDIGRLDIGQTQIIRVELVLDEDTTVKSLENVAVAKGEVCGRSKLHPTIVTGSGSDSIGIKIFDRKIKVEKYVDRRYSSPCEIVTFTINIMNEGDVPLYYVVLFDVLPYGIRWIYGSVKIDAMPDPYANLYEGIEIGTLAVGEDKIITFEAQVVDDQVASMLNRAEVEYVYTLPDGQSQIAFIKSNQVELRTRD